MPDRTCWQRSQLIAAGEPDKDGNGYRNDVFRAFEVLEHL